MKLLIMRHGEAERVNGSDFSRCLTPCGIEAVRESCGYLVDPKPDLIISSPLVRARQTAQLVIEVTAYKSDLILWEELRSCYEPGLLVDKLSGVQADNLLLVSHQPLVSNLVSYLAGESVYMDTAQVSCIVGNQLAMNMCKLEWIR